MAKKRKTKSTSKKRVSGPISEERNDYGPPEPEQMGSEPERSLPDTLFVTDSNAEPGKTRSHEVIAAMNPETGEPEVTVSYKLSRDNPVEMPAGHAVQFLRDQAFLVIDHDGNRLQPVKKHNPVDVRPNLELGETVARYDELDWDALHRRCCILPGFDPKADYPRSEMVEFLTDNDRKARQMVGVSRGSEHKAAEMSVDQLDNLIEVEPAGPAPSLPSMM